MSSIYSEEELIKRLKEHKLTDEFILKSGYTYFGGDRSYHHDNFIEMMAELPRHIRVPFHEDQCLCGHYIEEQCYIRKGNRVLVIGNDCIERFQKLSKYKVERQCELCNKKHKNTKINRCIKCRDRCSGCGFYPNINLITKPTIRNTNMFCEICDKKHQNTKMNRCKQCRYKCKTCILISLI